VRAGFILTRADLVRAGAELGLGVRAGERRYALRHLLAQEPGAVLHWLCTEAGRQVAARQPWHEAAGRVSEFWDGRAVDATRLLADLCAVESMAAR
jgi:hypothetical protein